MTEPKGQLIKGDELEILGGSSSFAALLREEGDDIRRDVFMLLNPEDSMSGRLQAGITIVYAGCSTRGHSHADREEVYFFTCEGLRMTAESPGFAPGKSPLRAMALLLAYQGDLERAVELYVLVSRYPVVSNSRLSEDIAGKYITAFAASLPPEEVKAAEERGRARDLEATVAELLAELAC